MKHSLLLGCLIALTAFGAETGIVTPKDRAIAKAQEAAHRLHSMMKSEIKPKIGEGDLLDAVRFCADKSAGKIRQLDRELGPDVSIKRVSLENRNPDAYPAPGERDIVRAFELMETSDVYLPSAIVQMIDTETYKVYMPATMASRSCKKCHGKADEIDPKVQTFLSKTYPDDKATGFRSGQVRGAVVVTVRIHD